MVHSVVSSMALRRFLLLSVVPSAVAFAVSCAPVHILGEFGNSEPAVTSGGGGGNGGSLSAGATSAGAGGGLELTDAGTFDGALAPPKVGSYSYLCGGSEAACVTAPVDSCGSVGSAGTGGAGDASQLGCQLVNGDGDGGVAAQCGTVGSGADGDPCESASDCQAGLGCIDAGVISICRAYCCASSESCRTGTYCTPAPLANAPSTAIPVCTPVTPCELLDTASCSSGQTCAIVRESGTTSCVVPGTGTAQEPCPCAAGYTCSWSDGICLQLCEISDAGVCGNGYCQGGTLPYPAGVGFCVSY